MLAALTALSTDAVAVLYVIGFVLIIAGIARKQVGVLIAGILVLMFTLCWNAIAFAGWGW